jgi:hypothetical protein
MKSCIEQDVATARAALANRRAVVEARLAAARCTIGCPSSIEKSQFLPDRNVTPAADNFFTTRRHGLALGKCGGVKGRSRRQPVRAAQPLRPSPLPSTLEMPCDRADCD